MNTYKAKAVIVSGLIAFFLTMSLALAFAGLASAGEKVLDAKITDIVSKIDKKGNPYTRAIVQEDRQLQGVKYSVGVPVMGFGAQHEVLKTYRAGQNLKAIVSSREYNGRTSYTVVQMIDKMDDQ